MTTQTIQHERAPIDATDELLGLLPAAQHFLSVHFSNKDGVIDIKIIFDLLEHPERIDGLAKELVDVIANSPESEAEERHQTNYQSLITLLSYFARLGAKDGLTGLFNKKSFGEALEQKISRLQKQQSLDGEQRENSHLEKGAALLYIDLDQFKPFNDIFDHQTGDAAIIAAAHLLKSQSRDNDIAGRLGGDEYALLISNVDEQGAGTVLGKYQNAFSKLYIEIDRDRIIKLDDAKLKIIGKESGDYKASDLTFEDYKKLGMRVEFEGDKLKLFIGASFGMAMVDPKMTAADVELSAEKAMVKYKADHRGTVTAFVPR